jgi:circadian clock protein KaiC
MIWARSTSGSAETHMVRIRETAHAQGSRCVVVDPISALSKSGNKGNARDVVERLIDWAKAESITLFCTSLLDANNPAMEGTPLQVSTLADTWIHLSYLVHAGERNRALSIIKSRGTSHSNQVRELILDARGVTLADIYTAGGEVLMGTMRWEKEQAERLAAAEAEAAAERQRLLLEAETFELEGRLKALQHELTARRAGMASLRETAQSTAAAEVENQRALHRIRRGDAHAESDETGHD